MFAERLDYAYQLRGLDRLNENLLLPDLAGRNLLGSGRFFNETCSLTTMCIDSFAGAYMLVPVLLVDGDEFLVASQ